MTYLETHPPARPQYRARRRTVTGAIVIHTAECATDITGPDTAAENVARFISTRTDTGSYHSVVDSDSVVHVVPYGMCAYHEGTGGNDWSLGLSFATRAADWPATPIQWRDRVITLGAAEAARMASWAVSQGAGRPVRRISANEYRNGHPGFVTHAELDPKRRTDPGVDFPWTQFLTLYATHTAQETPTVPTSAAQEAAQRAINAWLEPVHHIRVDGNWGDKSTTALNHLLDQVIKPLIEDQRARLSSAEGTLDAMRARVADLEAHAANIQAGAGTDSRTIALATIGAETVKWVETVTAQLTRIDP